MKKSFEWDIILEIITYRYIVLTFTFISTLVISSVFYKFLNLYSYVLINCINIISYGILMRYKYNKLYIEFVKEKKIKHLISLNVKITKFVENLRKDRVAYGITSTNLRNIAVKIYVSQNMYDAIPIGYIVSDDIQFIVDDRKDGDIGFSHDDKQIVDVNNFFY